MRASFALEENECGNGALDVSEEVDFDVTVDIEDHELDWIAESVGDYLTGSISGDSFLMTDAHTSDQGGGCVVEVTSRYVGTFEEANGSVTNMEGELVIEYEAQEEDPCEPLIGSSSGFRDLPCEVVYSFDLDVDD